MKSKKILFFILFGLFFCSPLFAQKIITLRPQIDEQSQQSVNLMRVELTDKYTILWFNFKNTTSRGSRSQQEEFEEEMYRLMPGLRRFRQQSTGYSYIEIDPRTRLYEPKNTSKKYRFMKAEGIPVAPDTMVVSPGQVVNFKVYFQRLDPGVEVFDMFEGNNEGSKQFWNYYGVHIQNPKIQPKAKPAEGKKAEPPVVAQTPKPTLPAETKTLPAAFATVRGTVLNAKTKQPIAAKISYAVPNDENGFDSLQLSASSGKFKLSIEPGRSYDYVASATGYFPSNGAFDLSKTAAGQETNAEILLTPLAVGEALTLNNVYFDISKYDLLPNSYAELDRLVAFMNENPRVEIQLEGHTDNVGDFDENVALSLNRANAIKQYLVSKGIASARVVAKGLGPTQPVSKGTSEAERRRNRRVEFKVMKS